MQGNLELAMGGNNAPAKTHAIEGGSMPENFPSLPEEKCFHLTSPFIEPAFRLTPTGDDLMCSA